MAVPTAGQHRPRNNESRNYFSVDGGLCDLVQHGSLADVLAESG